MTITRVVTKVVTFLVHTREKKSTFSLFLSSAVATAGSLQGGIGTDYFPDALPDTTFPN